MNATSTFSSPSKRTVIKKKNRVLTISMRNFRHIGVNESLCLKRKWLEKAEEKSYTHWLDGKKKKTKRKLVLTFYSKLETEI